MAIRRVVPGLLGFAIFVAGAATAPAQATAPAATMEDLQALYAKGEIRPCLQQLSRLLGMGRSLPQGFNRSDLFFLRGECLLAQKDNNSALTAFENSKREATTPAQTLSAQSMAVLVRASTSLGFRPANSTQQIDIASRESRKAAMAALFSQKLPGVQRQVDTAIRGRTLPPLKAQLPAVLDVAALEYGATGATTQSLETAAKLGDRARDLISQELNNTQGDLAQIQARANTVVTDNATQWYNTSGRTWWEGVERVGLTAEDRNFLRNRLPYLQQILEACKDGLEMAQAYGGNVEAWKAITSNCEKQIALLEQIAMRE